MPATAPLTKLEAINAMVHDIGGRPVNTLVGSSRLDITRAVNSLEQVSRSLQQRGWWFNTERFVATVDNDGYYNISDDITHVEVVSGGPTTGPQSQTPCLVMRGRKLYDVNNGTDEFIGAPNVTLVGVRLLGYEDLPSTAREYVYTAASVRYQSRSIGSSAVDADLREQARVALSILHEEEIDALNVDGTTSRAFLQMMYNR